MKRVIVKNPEAFAKAYPHLVRTSVVPDVRKINTALHDGWKLDHIEFVEGPAEEGTVLYENQGTAAESPLPAAPTHAPAPASAPAPAVIEPKEKEKTLGEFLGITKTPEKLPDVPGTPALPPGFVLAPGETMRDAHERAHLESRLEAIRKRALENAAKSPA